MRSSRGCRFMRAASVGVSTLMGRVLTIGATQPLATASASANADGSAVGLVLGCRRWRFRGPGSTRSLRGRGDADATQRSDGQAEAEVRVGAGVEGRRAVGCEAPPAGGRDHGRVVGAHRPAGQEAVQAVGRRTRRGTARAAASWRPRRRRGTGPWRRPRPRPAGPWSRARRRPPPGTTAATSAVRDVGVLAHVVDDRGLQPAEGEVEARRRASPAGRRSPSGRPPSRSRSIAGPPG